MRKRKAKKSNYTELIKSKTGSLLKLKRKLVENLRNDYGEIKKYNVITLVDGSDYFFELRLIDVDKKEKIRIWEVVEVKKKYFLTDESSNRNKIADVIIDYSEYEFSTFKEQYEEKIYDLVRKFDVENQNIAITNRAKELKLELKSYRKILDGKMKKIRITTLIKLKVYFEKKGCEF